MPDINQIIAQLTNRANGAAALARDAIDQSKQTNSALIDMAKLIQKQNGMLAGIANGGPRGDVRRIEDLPGRRIPFDVVIEIPVGANQNGPFSQTYTVTPDGPFVCVTRSAIFLSSMTFQVVDTQSQSVATFQGRSYGRYRPISSHLDIMDAQGGTNNPASAAAPGTGLMQLVSKTDKAGFRTMQWDGTIAISNTIFRRQSTDVPSALWAPGFESGMQLSVLDYYNMGETIEVIAQPNHVNNPPFGNIQSIATSLPFLAGQFDGHEGIGYTANPGVTTTDPIVRQPDGILIVMLHGFRITTAPGVE